MIMKPKTHNPCGRRARWHNSQKV